MGRAYIVDNNGTSKECHVQIYDMPTRKYDIFPPIYPSSVELFSTTHNYILYKCSYKRELLAVDLHYISEERSPQAQ